MHQILVHEPTSYWTAEFERAFELRTDLSFRWRPYREELVDEVALSSVVVLAGPADDGKLVLLRTIRAHAPSIRIMCVIEQSIPQWEWLARELGADVVLSETVGCRAVANSLRRILMSTGLCRRNVRTSPRTPHG